MAKQTYNVFVLDRNGIPHHKERVAVPAHRTASKRAQGPQVGRINTQTMVYSGSDGSGMALTRLPAFTPVVYVNDGQVAGGHQWTRIQWGGSPQNQGYVWDTIVNWGPAAQGSAPAAPPGQGPYYAYRGKCLRIGGISGQVDSKGFFRAGSGNCGGTAPRLPSGGGNSQSKSVVRTDTFPDGSTRTYYSDHTWRTSSGKSGKWSQLPPPPAAQGSYQSQGGYQQGGYSPQQGYQSQGYDPSQGSDPSQSQGYDPTAGGMLQPDDSYSGYGDYGGDGSDDFGY